MSAYEPFVFVDADEEEAPPASPESKGTPAKVTKVAKQYPLDRVLPEFGNAGAPELPPDPDRYDRRCYMCASFDRSPYGYPLGLCAEHRNRIQHSTSEPTRFGCGSFEPKEVRP